MTRASATLLGLLSLLVTACGAAHHPRVAASRQAAVAAVDPTTEPLVQAGGLAYQGSFRLSYGIFSGGKANAGFEYSEGVTGFNPAHNSLFMVGHDWDQFVGEITIPTPVIGALSALPRAALLQPLVDIAEGGKALVNPGDPNAIKVGGLLPYNGKLYSTAYPYYDGNGSAVLSHFVSGLTLSVTGDSTGPWQVGTTVGIHKSAAFVDGPMALIPPEWQAAFGGRPVITGNCCLAVASRSSWGPCAFAIDPANLGVTVPLPMKPLVCYTAENPLAQWASQNTLYNGTTNIHGIVFPAGTRSVLFFGAMGMGPWCYGAGTTNQALDGTLTSDGVTKYCYDLVSQDKGTHAFPYIYQVWAYDANDLAKAAAGQVQPWTIRPYAVWPLTLPYGQAGFAGPLGAAYDPATGRIFLTQAKADGSGPVVHVYTVGAAPPPPPPPPPPPDPIACVMSNWSPEPCTPWISGATEQTCTQTRTVLTPASNGGTPCPTDATGAIILTQTLQQPLPPPPLPPPPPLTTVTGTMTAKDCTLRIVSTNPYGVGGTVQFYRNPGVKQGSAFTTPDANGIYTRSASVLPGTYNTFAIWTKSGQPTITSPVTTFKCELSQP